MRRTVYDKKKRSLVIRICIALLIVFFLVFFLLEMKIKPVTRSIAMVQARSFAAAAINETVTEVLEEMQITPDSLEIVSVRDGGELASLSTNTVIVNKLKNMITLRVQQAISDIKNKRIEIPLGTVLGTEIWNGMGPGVPVYISLSGSVNSDFEEKLESGGINQTVHKLSVRVCADIQVIMPSGSGSERVETTVLIGETVIVGKTPDGICTGLYNR